MPAWLPKGLLTSIHRSRQQGQESLDIVADVDVYEIALHHNSPRWSHQNEHGVVQPAEEYYYNAT